MSYSDIEKSLGIKNFRKEYLGQVQSLSSFAPIDPVIEPLSNASTFNTRFKKLQEAMRHCFNAAGDIAIRDKRYLETFLAGYTNPLVTASYQYETPNVYKNVPTFNVSGVPIQFPEDRIVYNVANLGELNYTNCYHWVFKNGVLLEQTDYDIINTAYGVKCFVKASIVAANDAINIVVNRIYNLNPNSTSVQVSTGGLNSSFIVPVTSFGTFYHTKYLRVYVQRGTDPRTSYLEIPRANYTTEINTTGTSVKVDVRDWNLNPGEQIHIMNTVYWWKYEVTGNTGTDFSNEVELSELLEGGTYRPVPFMSIHDFDVFFNGHHLRPGVHYTIIKGGNEFSPYKLKLLFNPDQMTDYSWRIYKNESVAQDADFLFISEDTMDPKGLIETHAAATLPLMPRLGHCFLGDKYVSNQRLTQHSRRIMSVDNPETTDSFYYCLRVVSSLDIDNVLSFVNDNISEFDMITTWLGSDFITDKLRLNLDDVVDDPLKHGFTDSFTGGVWEHYDVLTAAVEQFRVIHDAYLANELDRELTIDPNTAFEQPYPVNIVDDMLVLDSTMLQSEIMILDANTYFVQP